MDPQEEQQTEQVDEAQALADMQAGFEGKPTETPAVPEKTDPAPAPVEPAPEYVQITKKDWDEIQSRAAKVDDLRATQEKSFGTAFGKIGGLERALNARQAIELPKDKLEYVRAEMPEIAEIFDGMKVAQGPGIDQDQVIAKTREGLAPDLAKVAEQAEERAYRRLSTKLLSTAHKDWEEVTNSADFVNFAKAQGDGFIADLAKASDAWDHVVIGDAVQKFKDSKTRAASKAATRRDRLESAVNPRGTPSPAAGVKSAEDDFNEGFKTAR